MADDPDSEKATPGPGGGIGEPSDAIEAVDAAPLGEDQANQPKGAPDGGGSSNNNPLNFFRRLTFNEGLTAALSVVSVVVAILGLINALNTKDLKEAVSALNRQAGAMASEVTETGKEVNAIGGEVNAIEDQATATGSVAKAGQTANAIARDTSRRQLRAYITIVPEPVDNFVGNARPSWGVFVQGMGDTPAFNVTGATPSRYLGLSAPGLYPRAPTSQAIHNHDNTAYWTATSFDEANASNESWHP